MNDFENRLTFDPCDDNIACFCDLQRKLIASTCSELIGLWTDGTVGIAVVIFIVTKTLICGLLFVSCKIIKVQKDAGFQW